MKVTCVRERQWAELERYQGRAEAAGYAGWHGVRVERLRACGVKRSRPAFVDLHCFFRAVYSLVNRRNMYIARSVVRFHPRLPSLNYGARACFEVSIPSLHC
eukprot:6189201-Pleurochrysis_carterae.AAC.1